MKRVLAVVGVAILVVGVCLVAVWAAEEHPQDKPLKLGFDMGYVPFHYWSEAGEPLGFGIEVSEEVARRLGRPGIEVVDVNWSGIFAGLQAGQYEAIFFTLNITHERAEFLDYSEPFLEAGMMMIARAEEAEKFDAPEALSGYKVGVNSGSVADYWLTDNSATYGFTIERYDKVDDAVMALITKKVDAVLAQTATMSTFVREKPSLVPTFMITPEEDFGLGRRGYAFGFREEDPFRYEVERVLEGMKLDGTLQGLIVPYFGEPAPDSYANVVFAGYGCPGLAAYEPGAYHAPYFPGE